MIDMVETLSGAKNGRVDSVERAGVLLRANEAIKNLKQPGLESLYKKHKRPFPSDSVDQDTLTVFYAARLCLGINGSLIHKDDAINSVRLVRLDEVLEGDSKGKRMQIAESLKSEIDFVRGLTPFEGKALLIKEMVSNIED